MKNASSSRSVVASAPSESRVLKILTTSPARPSPCAMVISACRMSPTGRIASRSRITLELPPLSHGGTILETVRPLRASATLIVREPLPPAKITRCGITGFRRSFRLVEQFPPDQHSPNLGRSRTYLIQLRIPPDPPGREFVDVAVAAERLDRLAGHPRRLLRGVEDRTCRILSRGASAVPAIQRARYRVDVRAASRERRVHVGELALHQLELADRLAELLPLVHVRNHRVQRRRHQSERAAGEHGALV